MKFPIVSIIKNIQIPAYHINKQFKMKTFKSFPFLSFSNGSPCFPANMYLQSGEVIKLSELTIIKIGYALSSLIEFCENKNIEFKDFNNSFLFLFSQELQNELDSKDLNKKARNNNSTNFILKTTLYFFDFIGKTLLNNPNFCKMNLNAELRGYKIAIEERGSIEKDGWYHNSLVKKDNVKRRIPISMKNIEKLYSVIPELSNSKYVQHRTKIMLKLLEITGARAGEIAKLKTKDIEEAYSQDRPMLKMVTLKRRNGEEIRYVPVEQLDLKELITFIKIYRYKVIRETVGKNNDSGFLFLNERNGSPLLPATISNEIIKLRDLAGISAQTCAHMFRHRYITNLFVKLIKQYDLENQDDFRNALLDINSLKVHIQQATGHKDLRSLDHYIELAKAELTNIDSILDKVNQTQKYESIEREKKRLLEDLKNGSTSIENYVKHMEGL